MIAEKGKTCYIKFPLFENLHPNPIWQTDRRRRSASASSFLMETPALKTERAPAKKNGEIKRVDKPFEIIENREIADFAGE